MKPVDQSWTVFYVILTVILCSVQCAINNSVRAAMNAFLEFNLFYLFLIKIKLLLPSQLDNLFLLLHTFIIIIIVRTLFLIRNFKCIMMSTNCVVLFFVQSTTRKDRSQGYSSVLLQISTFRMGLLLRCKVL